MGSDERSQQTGTANEVVVTISAAEEGPGNSKQSSNDKNIDTGSYSFSSYLPVQPPNPQLPELETVVARKKVSSTMTNPSSAVEITSIVRSQKTPAEITPRRSLGRSAYSKAKSRLVEPSYPISWKLDEESTEWAPSSSPYRTSPSTVPFSSKLNGSNPKENPRTDPFTPETPNTPIMESAGEEDDADNDVYKTGILQPDVKQGKKVKVMVIIEWAAFVCIMIVLVASVTVSNVKNFRIWSLETWKWCVLVLVVFCGRLFTGWFTNMLVFLIERNFLLKKKVLYFVYNLKWSVRVFIWLGLILMAWALLINRGVRRSKKTTRILNYITRALGSSLFGATLWMLKTFGVKLLAASFHVQRFFDRIQESIFHQYTIQTLSWPPLIDYPGSIGSCRTTTAQFSLKSPKTGKQGENEEVIDVQKLQNMKREKVSAWTMGGLIKVISSGLSTLSDALDDSIHDEGIEQKEKVLTSECEAKAAAYRIFKNVAKKGASLINEGDLLRFMNMEEVDNFLPLFEGAVATGKIKKSSFCNWVVNVYNERKFLAHSLNDTKTAIEQLNKVVSGIALVVIIIVWVLLMGLATTQVLLFIASQLLLLVFMFGDTCKTAFEAIIFVFIMHPFDVGDRCSIDGVQMVVEEMNIFTTIFLRYDNEKIYYPNSVLATRPISNFNRSPEMSDSVEFAVDVSTSAESIASLKAKIKMYLESKPQYWRPGHGLRIKEIEDLNKLNMSLSVTHTMNFQNYGEKCNRVSKLVFELKKFFEELGIKYHVLPQEVQIRCVGFQPQQEQPSVDDAFA